MFLTAHTFIHTCTHTCTSYLHTIPTLHTAHLPTSVTLMRERSSRGLAPHCGLRPMSQVFVFAVDSAFFCYIWMYR